MCLIDMVLQLLKDCLKVLKDHKINLNSLTWHIRAFKLWHNTYFSSLHLWPATSHTSFDHEHLSTYLGLKFFSFNILPHSVFRSCIYFTRLTLKYFTVLCVFISICNCSLLAYRNTMIFVYWSYILQLGFVNSLIILVSFIVVCRFFGISSYIIMLFINKSSYIFSSSICMSFISFSSITAIGMTSNTLLNGSDKSRRPCLVPDTKGKTLNFLTWC